MSFITSGRNNKGSARIKIWAALLWVVVWEAAARLIGQEILLVSPVIVLRRFLELITVSEFWKSVFFSFCRIAGGFFSALLAGIILAWISAFCRFIKELAAPLIAVIKATPVASFIILILIWVPSRNLSCVISFLMVLPVIYTNRKYGQRAFRNGGGIQDSLSKTYSVYLFIGDDALCESGMFRFFGIMLEGWYCSGSDWHSCRFHWRKTL